MIKPVTKTLRAFGRDWREPTLHLWSRFATSSFALTVAFYIITSLISPELGGPAFGLYWLGRGVVMFIAPLSAARWLRNLLGMIGAGRTAPFLVGWAILLSLNSEETLLSVIQGGTAIWATPLIVAASLCLVGGMVMSIAADEAVWFEAQASKP